MAAILSLVWAALGVSGFLAAYKSGRWMLVVAAIFALVYATLWARVAVLRGYSLGGRSRHLDGCDEPGPAFSQHGCDSLSNGSDGLPVLGCIAPFES